MAKKKNNMLVDFIENFKKVLSTPEQTNQTSNTSTNQKSTFQLPTRETWQSFQNDRQQRENVANNILSTNRNNSMATKSTAEMLNNNGNNFFNNLNNNFKNLPKPTKKENINAKGISEAYNATKSAVGDKTLQNNAIKNGDYQIGGTFKNTVNQRIEEQKEDNQQENKIETKNLSETVKNKEDANFNKNFSKGGFSKLSQENVQEAMNNIVDAGSSALNDAARIADNIVTGGFKGVKDAGDFLYRFAKYNYDQPREIGFKIGKRLTGEAYEDDGDYSYLGTLNKSIPDDEPIKGLVNKAYSKQKEIYSKLEGNSANIDEYFNKNISKNIEEANNPVSQEIAEIAPSIGQQLPAMAMGPFSAPYFFFSAGGSYYKDAKERGMSEGESVRFGTALGALEMLTEEFQLEKFMKTAKLSKGGMSKQLLKEYGINLANNFVQEAVMEPFTELGAQIIGGKDKANWEGIWGRSFKAGFDGAIMSIIMDGSTYGINSATKVENKLQNNEDVTQEELTQAIKDVQDSGKVDVEEIFKKNMNQQANKLKDYLLSKGVETTSVIDKSKMIDEKLGTNLLEDVKKAVNSGKLDKNTYQELNNKLDQVVQAENTDDLYKQAERLDDILELKDTKQSLTGIVEKLSKENRLNDELSQNLKAAFTEIDNQMPYVAETSDNKKIDVFREDMMNFMNNSERAHNFAKSVESIIEKTGLNIRLNNELASDENGRIFNQNGETIIEINPNSESAGEFILMHELTHAIGNQDLKQTILDYANKNKEFEAALKDFEARYGQTDITEEVMADISGQLLGNEEFINSLAQEQPSKFKQIYNAVKSWVKKFTGTYGYEDFVRDVEAKWRKAYEQNKNSITENIDQKILNNKAPLEEIPLFSKNAKENSIQGLESYSPQTDNQGRTLSKEQQEYFKDSKVRDKDGNLIEVYHGTEANVGIPQEYWFTVFDRDKAGSHGAYLGAGFYFTANKEHAQGYAKDKGNVVTAYLKITNPYTQTQDVINKDGTVTFAPGFYEDFENRFKNQLPSDWGEINNYQKARAVRNILEDNGYDGVISGDTYVAFESNQIKNVDNQNPTSNPDIRYSKGPAKVTDNQSRTLLAEHNLTEDKLKSILDLGGFPVPSIAITNPDINSHEEFGDISVIFDKNTIDPANRQNEVYDRDVWSPTFPKVDYDINNSDIKKYITNNIDYDYKDSIISDAITKYMYESNLSDMIDRYGIDKTLETLKDSNELKYFYKTSVEKDSNYKPAMKQANYSSSDSYENTELQKFLDTYNGEKPLNELNYQETLDLSDTIADIIKEKFYKDAEKLPTKEMQDSYKKLSNEVIDSFRGNYNKLNQFIYSANKMKQNGIDNQVIDKDATLKNISKEINQKEYEKWIDNTFGKMFENTKKGIRNDKDVYTNSGNRRSFEKLHDEYNLQNIVKAMTNIDTKAGQKTFFEGGFGKVSARLSNQFNSIEDIKNSENRISKSEEIKPRIEELTDTFNNDLHELSPYFTKTDYKSDFVSELQKFEKIQEAVFEFAGKKDLSINNFKKVLDSFYGFQTEKVPIEKLQNIIKDLNEMKNLPTDYFEAKPQRAVGFDEVKAIVVPNDISPDLKQQLIDKGMNLIEYDKNIEGDRQAKIRELDSYKFSKQSDKWQEWLEKNFPSRGTTTKFSDILLPNANIQNNNTQTNIKFLSDSVINKIEQGLKNIYPVDLDNEQLKEIATNMANNPTEEGILEALKDYRTAYLEDETADNEIINEIKSTIRNTKLDVSNLKNSITDYNDLRKANFGKLKLGNDGSKIDTFYQELSSTYPDYFNSEISNEADQLDAIIDFINEDQTTKTEYQMTDEDIINSGLIDAVTTALNTEQTETIKETPKEAVKETTENDLIKRNKELYKQRYNLEKEAQRLDRKIELTDNEKGIVKSLLNGDITIDEIPTRYAEHKDSIIQKYQNDKALNEVRNEIKKNKEQSKSVYNTTADEVVKNLSKFKDKSKGIFYRRETAIRNIQDVVKDKVLADKINNTYFKPVLENEAARTRYINDNMQKINDLKIDTKKTYPYSNPMVDKNGKKYMENLKINEADIAGLYLEKKISDDYLTKNHIDKARIEKIADTFKSILDDGINNMETEVMKAGYAPIGRIENYFPHFMETRPDGLIGKISNFIGIRTKVKSLPTEIAGKTDTFKPGKTWNQNALHREGDITDINALKAMENYINGASDVIYHTDDIQKLRALERSIRESYTDKETQKSIKRIQQDTELTKIEKEEAINQKLENIRTEIPNFVTWLREYTDVLANKKSQSDRNMEYTWGRQTYTTMQDIENKIASNMIGGNLSVSLTNFAPLSQAMGTTKVGNVLIGMLETTQNTIKNVFGNGDNFVDSSDFLTRRRGTETIHKLKASEKLSNVLGKPMEIIDNFTSEAIVRTKYRKNLQNGMTEMEALKNADEYTANLMADRSKGAIPTLFNAKNPISKLVTMFQVEPNNILSNYTKDWRNYNGNKAVAIAKLTVASYAFNTILKSLRGGSDILPDPINIVSQLIKMMTTDDEEEKKKAQDELISSITGSIPFGTTAAVLGQALGLDVPDSVQNSGRMPIASAIPNWRKVYNGFNSDSPEYKAQELYREFMKPLLYLGLPTGGAQINKTIEGLKAYEKGGSYKYNSKGEKLLQFPVKQNMTNLIKSATFGKYSTPEGQEYATNFDAFNAKQTKLYDETDIDYKDLKKYYKDTKGQKDLAKMQYVDDMDISDNAKVELYKSDILSEKQAENLDYALDHKITTKKTFDDEYQKLQEKNISLPTKEDYQMMNSADISLKNYSDYKVATKGLKTEAEKNKALRNLSCSSKTKQAIYENTTGKDDETYQSVKNVISINNYLDYKSQKFVADKDENGKAISGSRKQKLIDYLNSNRNMNYQEKLIVLGMNNKLSSGELTVVFNYVNSQKLTAKQKIAILKKVKGFKINGNNISW